MLLLKGSWAAKTIAEFSKTPSFLPDETCTVFPTSLLAGRLFFLAMGFGRATVVRLFGGVGVAVS
jgi:hypothetical protein